MKKVGVLLVIAFMLFNMLGVIPVSMGANNSEYVEVHIDGTEAKVRKINVTINDQNLESDVPPILYESRTLVPIRFIAESLDADVAWNQETKEVTIDSLGKEIILTIDSSEVVVNGEKKELPYGVPAKLVNDGRTMVPIRFVTEELGCNVDWDEETWTAIIDLKEQEIIDIAIDNETYIPRIVVKSTGPILHEIIELEDSNKIVLDIPNSILNIKNKDKLNEKGVLSLDGDRSPVKVVRSSQFEVDPNVTRVVIDLDEMTDYDVTNLEDGNGFEVTFTNKTTDIRVEEVDGKEAIVIYNSKEIYYNTFNLKDPDRIVIDLMSSRYDEEKYEYDLDSEVVERVRVAQFDHDGNYNANEDVVRVVVDIKEDSFTPHLTTEVRDNNLVLFLEAKDFSTISYEPIEEMISTLKFTTLEPAKYNIVYNETVKMMVVSIEKDKIDTPEGILTIDDKLVEDIIVKDGEQNKLFYIQFKEDVMYLADKNDKDNEININVGSLSNQYRDKLIVIDAGHGGKDPGTRGVNTSVKEKTLNLLVAKKLAEKLNEAGFQTVLTRDSDEYIGLYDRADIANATDGDAFISIHFNAHNDSSISGIETIYCPSYESDVKTGDNYPFAEVLHNALLEELGRIDRGIDRRPEIVVTRETKMVAALLELGFVSNPEEEALVIETDYIDRAIESIVDGLKEYFKE